LTLTAGAERFCDGSRCYRLSFPHAGHEVIPEQKHRPLGGRAFEPDRALGCAANRPDMIVGEGKEGPARFNPATRDPVVWEMLSPDSGVVRRTRQLNWLAAFSRGARSRPHWEVLRHVQVREEGLSVLALLEKWRDTTPVDRGVGSDHR
jgi:hypothetical protein